MRLKRADVLAGALRVLDAEGLAGLTMRRLATDLNVAPGALYWHFADKRALLDAMAEHVIAGIEDVDPDEPWDRRVVEVSHRVRAALRSHRDGARLHAGTFVLQPHTLRVGNAYLRAFLDAGLPRDQAATTLFSVLHYVLGHTIEEQAREELMAAGAWTTDISGVPGTDAPEFADLAAALAGMDALDADTRFDDGLRTIVAGVRLRVAEADAPPRD
ncbi:TetR/AcrR family transcriptional regulator C-terminal domain-containing protein [Streptomyces sp. NPDC091292]|uniref:TetR/AcrR family transcriptional regulator C-terminal domain-containing protein n=1 Tax=Streptomyces sp. NPDC091292 TaxID=3365991 RepID=UPI00381C20E6